MHNLHEIDQEIISMVILPLLLIQEGSCQLLTKYVHEYWLTT